MTKLIELAQQVMDDWNQIAVPFMAYAAQTENSPERDDIWRTLLKVHWPWTIVITEDAQAERLVPLRAVRLPRAPALHPL